MTRQQNNVQEQDVNQLRKVRREKLADLQANGKDPFKITKYDVTCHAADIKDHYEEMLPAIDKAALDLYAKDPEEAVRFLTWYSSTTADAATARWKKLGEYLLVKYIDGNIKREENGHFKDNGYGLSASPISPGYGEQFYRMIVIEAGDRLKVK